MKEMDKRNIRILHEVVSTGEVITARQAVDRLVEYQLQRRGSMNYIPNINRMSYILKQASGFAVSPKKTTKPMSFVRVG